MFARSTIKLFIITVLVTLLVFLAYKEALNNGFINWDTHAYVTENENIKSLEWKNLQWMLTSFYLGNWHPLTWLSHALDYAIFGLNPWGHHLTNIVIHCLNTILVGILVIILMTWQRGLAWTNANVENHQVLFAAVIAALLFGIHPQNVESVVWIAERKNVLSQFFLLLGILCYGFYVKGPSTKIRYYGYLTTFGCFILALMSKPIAVVFPLILMLIDIYPLHRTSLTVSSKSAKSASYVLLMLEKVPFLALSLVVGIITIFAQHTSGYMADTQQLNISIRLLNAANSSLFYLSKFLFPIGLSPFYPLSNFSKDYQHYSNFIPVMGFVLITIVCSYLWYRKRYEWLIAWLFYLMTLLPVIGLIQVGSQAAADRYAYLSILPFHILVGVGIASLFYSISKFKKLIQIAIIGAILSFNTLLVYLTQQQVRIWQNDLKFWSYVVLSNPDNIIGQIYLGTAYFEAGYYEKALAHYLLVKPVAPYHLFYHHLAVTYVKLGKPIEALEICNQALQQNEKRIAKDEIYTLTGWIYFEQGNLAQAQILLEKALEINPEQNTAKNLLASMAKNRNH
ncbi:MAG: hypothetical protein BWK79_03720 [Beggiatoa sp. IS2]|nr:MAG: hypothetical protein BWK79_03720 [Beggiatoa sp. IS2]